MPEKVNLKEVAVEHLLRIVGKKTYANYWFQPSVELNQTELLEVVAKVATVVHVQEFSVQSGPGTRSTLGQTSCD